MTQNCYIKILAKCVGGGLLQRDNKIKILFQNMNGLHAQGQNLHKLKENNRISEKLNTDL